MKVKNEIHKINSILLIVADSFTQNMFGNDFIEI